MYKKIITNMISKALRNKFDCPVYITSVKLNEDSVTYLAYYFNDDNSTTNVEGFVSSFGRVYCWNTETLDFEVIDK